MWPKDRSTTSRTSTSGSTRPPTSCFTTPRDQLWTLLWIWEARRPSKWVDSPSSDRGWSSPYNISNISCISPSPPALSYPSLAISVARSRASSSPFSVSWSSLPEALFTAWMRFACTLCRLLPCFGDPPASTPLLATSGTYSKSLWLPVPFSDACSPNLSFISASSAIRCASLSTASAMPSFYVTPYLHPSQIQALLVPEFELQWLLFLPHHSF